MTYKTVLVHLNDERRADGLLDAAVAVARVSGAHLKALNVMPPTIVVPDIEGGGGAVIADHRESYAAQAERLRATFEKALAGGITQAINGEWAALDCENENPFGLAVTVIVSQARAADIVVASQEDREWPLTSHLDVAEQLVMEAGRPVLVVPRSWRGATSFKRITVAWNNTREAARAAYDALPLLQQADNVRVVWVNPESSKHTAGDLPGVDLCEALARHGVKCEAAGVPAHDARAGHALLEAATAFKADLLVMGCYGHSRLREMILGGASRHIIQNAAIPVLMSH